MGRSRLFFAKFFQNRMALPKKVEQQPRKFVDMQAKCQVSFPDVVSGQRTAKVDIYKKVGSCILVTKIAAMANDTFFRVETWRDWI